MSAGLFTLISNNLLRRRVGSHFTRRFVRYPFAGLCGGILTYAMNLALLQPVLYNDFEEMGLA